MSCDLCTLTVRDTAECCDSTLSLISVSPHSSMAMRHAQAPASASCDAAASRGTLARSTQQANSHEPQDPRQNHTAARNKTQEATAEHSIAIAVQRSKPLAVRRFSARAKRAQCRCAGADTRRGEAPCECRDPTRRVMRDMHRSTDKSHGRSGMAPPCSATTAQGREEHTYPVHACTRCPACAASSDLPTTPV